MPSIFKNKSTLWICAVLVVVVAAVIYFRKPGLPLTADLLEVAKERWKENAVTEYSLALQVSGANEGLHEIEVKDGKVVGMSVDGVPVPEHVWVYWNVEGMFRFMAEELLRRENPKDAYGVEDKERVLLHAKFNGKYGYPQRFMRHVYQQKIGVEWKVLAFDIP